MRSHLATPPDDLGRALGKFLDLVPRSGSAEANEMLAQSLESTIRGATPDELRRALARIVDWLHHHESWIAQHAEAARADDAIQRTLLRGEMIHTAIRAGHRGPGVASKVLSARGEARIRQLTGLRRDWQSDSASTPS
ncbi:MAG: hypothetical protein RIB32_00585 [Phycisphaerales bacterium]